ncbi:hypothetical protein SFC43_15485 [Bacteroides sp. CR5/BHMF/2]|nr:hypothetical protein [Bacteroides sp. CR5/BHMF/2]
MYRLPDLRGMHGGQPVARPGTASSPEPVTVKLTLGIDGYNTSSDRKTRAEEMPPVLRMSSPDMDVELVATPAVTRAASSPP